MQNKQAPGYWVELVVCVVVELLAGAIVFEGEEVVDSSVVVVVLEGIAVS